MNDLTRHESRHCGSKGCQLSLPEDYQPVVLLDCDGVLADFQHGMLELINSVLATSHTKADWTSYYYEHALGLSRSDQQLVEQALLADKQFVLDLLPLPLVHSVPDLCGISRVYVVTSPWPRHPTWIMDRLTWLDEHALDVPHRRVHPMHDKWLHHGEFLVDDKVDTVRRWQAAHPEGTGVVWRNGTNTEPWEGHQTDSPDQLWEWVMAVAEQRSELWDNQVAMEDKL